VTVAAVRWGILSTARINRPILAAAGASQRAEIVAVGSRDQGRADAYAHEHGIARAHGSYEALLADTSVEAVYISLPNSLHVEWTVRALEAGKHVLCEKPFSRRPAEVERAFDLAAASGLVLSEALMWRHHPQARRLSELVAEGAIGRLRIVRATFSQQLVELQGPDDARFDPAFDGGSLMDLGCYCVSALRLLAGEPLSARGEQYVGPSGVDLSFAGALAFEDGVLGHFDCSFVLPRRVDLEVVGERGSLFLGDPWRGALPEIELRREDDTERIAVERADAYRCELENVSGAIRGDTPLLLGRDDAVGQARTLEALYAAAGERREELG
jgi:predicted dehydrogenase